METRSKRHALVAFAAFLFIVSVFRTFSVLMSFQESDKDKNSGIRRTSQQINPVVSIQDSDVSRSKTSMSKSNTVSVACEDIACGDRAAHGDQFAGSPYG